MRISWLLLGLVACAAPRSSQLPPSQTARAARRPPAMWSPWPRPGPDADELAAEMAALAADPAPDADAGVPVLDAAVDAPVDPTDSCEPADHAFCASAHRLAVRDGYEIAGWGTLRLDGSPSPYRFATLTAMASWRGAYLIEQSPDMLWLITYHYDGRTRPFWGLFGQGDVPPWSRLQDTGLLHVQTFHHGGESFHFALRGGELVVLDYHYGDVELPESAVQRTFARGMSYTRGGTLVGGRCATPCPRLAEFAARVSEIAVGGPAATVDDL